MKNKEFLTKIRECINEENFDPPHDLSFDTEIVLKFLERYFTSNKTLYLYSDALARTCKITKGQALHICCELRDAGLVDEYSDLCCSECFHVFGATLDKEELKEWIEDFECDTCGRKEWLVSLSYVFKVKIEEENLEQIKKSNEKYIQGEINTFLQDTEKAIAEGYDITKDPMYEIKVPNDVQWERLHKDPDYPWDEIERLKNVIKERDKEIDMLKGTIVILSQKDKDYGIVLKEGDKLA